MKLITLLKLVGYLKTKTEKKYSIYKLYANLGIDVKKEDFHAIYNQTFYDFEHIKSKHPKLVELFKIRTAKSSLQREYYNKAKSSLYDDLNGNLYVSDNFIDIRSSTDLEKEISEFLQIFNEKVNLTKSPKEIESSEKFNEVNKKLDRLIIQNTNIHLPEQLKEIHILRETNKHSAVIDLLTNFKRNKWNELTPELKYSVTLNLGVTYFGLGNKTKAGKYFTELLSFNYNQTEALGYASLGYALLDDTENMINSNDRFVDFIITLFLQFVLNINFDTVHFTQRTWVTQNRPISVPCLFKHRAIRTRLLATQINILYRLNAHFYYQLFSKVYDFFLSFCSKLQNSFLIFLAITNGVPSV